MSIDYRKEYHSLLKQVRELGRVEESVDNSPRLTPGHYYRVECLEDFNTGSAAGKFTKGERYTAQYVGDRFQIGFVTGWSSSGQVEHHPQFYSPRHFRVVGIPTPEGVEAVKSLDKLINGLQDFARSYHE